MKNCCQVFYFYFYNNIYTFSRSISVKVSRKVERARVFFNFYFYNNIYTFSRSISVKVSRKVERARVFFFYYFYNNIYTFSRSISVKVSRKVASARNRRQITPPPRHVHGLYSVSIDHTSPLISAREITQVL